MQKAPPTDLEGVAESQATERAFAAVLKDILNRSVDTVPNGAKS